jgi:hypothetical protein
MKLDQRGSFFHARQISSFPHLLGVGLSTHRDVALDSLNECADLVDLACS